MCRWTNNMWSAVNTTLTLNYYFHYWFIYIWFSHIFSLRLETVFILTNSMKLNSFSLCHRMWHRNTDEIKTTWTSPLLQTNNFKEETDLSKTCEPPKVAAAAVGGLTEEVTKTPRVYLCQWRRRWTIRRRRFLFWSQFQFQRFLCFQRPASDLVLSPWRWVLKGFCCRDDEPAASSTFIFLFLFHRHRTSHRKLIWSCETSVEVSSRRLGLRSLIVRLLVSRCKIHSCSTKTAAAQQRFTKRIRSKNRTMIKTFNTLYFIKESIPKPHHMSAHPCCLKSSWRPWTHHVITHSWAWCHHSSVCVWCFPDVRPSGPLHSPLHTHTGMHTHVAIATVLTRWQCVVMFHCSVQSVLLWFVNTLIKTQQSETWSLQRKQRITTFLTCDLGTENDSELVLQRGRGKLSFRETQASTCPVSVWRWR